MKKPIISGEIQAFVNKIMLGLGLLLVLVSFVTADLMSGLIGLVDVLAYVVNDLAVIKK